VVGGDGTWIFIVAAVLEIELPDDPDDGAARTASGSDRRDRFGGRIGEPPR